MTVSLTRPFPKAVGTVRPSTPSLSQCLLWSQITNTSEGWCPREGPFSGLPWRLSWLVFIRYLFLTLQMVSKQPFDFKSLQKIPKSHSKGDTSLYLLPFKIYTHWVPREGF